MECGMAMKYSKISFEESVAEIFPQLLITGLKVRMPAGTKQTQTISKPLK